MFALDATDGTELWSYTAEDQVGARARASGCARFLLKPVDIEALLAIVRSAPPREA